MNEIKENKSLNDSTFPCTLPLENLCLCFSKHKRPSTKLVEDEETDLD